MCTYSVAVDFGKNIPMDVWNPIVWKEFQGLLKQLAKADKKLGLANCEDPTKATWMKSVEDRLAPKKKKSKKKPKKTKKAIAKRSCSKRKKSSRK